MNHVTLTTGENSILDLSSIRGSRMVSKEKGEEGIIIIYNGGGGKHL